MCGHDREGSTLVLTDRICPWFLRDIESHLADVEDGEFVTLIATAGEQVATVASFVRGAGHTIVGTERRDGTVELTMRKEAPGSSDGSDECCPGGECR